MRFDRFHMCRVAPLGLFQHDGRRLKTYGIASGDSAPRKELRIIAPELARECLPQLAATRGPLQRLF
jgi:hypothetical protein